MGSPSANSAGAEEAASNVNRKAILLVVCIPTFFSVLNASAVVVLLPEIGAEFSVGSASLSWLMSGFLLVYGIAIPFFGRLADIYGARRFFLFGILLFSLGSLLAALAPNYELLLGARVVQALGGAALPGLGMTLASRAFGPGNRGAALGALSATMGSGAAIGPLLGGTMSAQFGWQSLFVNGSGCFGHPWRWPSCPRRKNAAASQWTCRITAQWLGFWSSAGLAGAALLLLGWRQRSAVAPFLPPWFCWRWNTTRNSLEYDRGRRNCMRTCRRHEHALPTLGRSNYRFEERGLERPLSPVAL